MHCILSQCFQLLRKQQFTMILLQDGRPARPGYAPKVEECFGPQDFRTGTVLNVYGRQLLIHDCDAFTCTWLQVLTSYEATEVPVCTVTLVLQNH